jgi:hypothetical protein
MHTVVLLISICESGVLCRYLTFETLLCDCLHYMLINYHSEESLAAKLYLLICTGRVPLQFNIDFDKYKH